MDSKLYDILALHLTDRKRELFEDVANNRTRYITLVLEDLYQAQNTSAIQRSAESWGLQDFYIIENEHPFMHHRRIAKGASDWMQIHRFNEKQNNSARCFQQLKDNGYQIAVTTLNEKSISVYDLDLTRKTAVVMGTELTGASLTSVEMADVFIKIPTYGFTESLNVGAASAVILQHLIEKVRRENLPWQLTPAEKMEVKIQWAKKSISWSKYLIEMYEAGELK